MNEATRFDLILQHYVSFWKTEPKVYLFDKGPIDKLSYDFRVLEFPPTKTHNFWIYCTCCMSSKEHSNPIELHILSSKQDESLIELLTTTAFYHKNSSSLNLWHTVNFGRGWQDNSLCEYGLISLPYLFGPDLETLRLHKTQEIQAKFYWLLPVTKKEVNYKKDYGIDALEQLFEATNLNYINPNRQSIL